MKNYNEKKLIPDNTVNDESESLLSVIYDSSFALSLVVIALVVLILIIYMLIRSAFFVTGINSTVYLTKEQVYAACGKKSKAGFYQIHQTMEYELFGGLRGRISGNYIFCDYTLENSVKIDNFPSIVMPAMEQLKEPYFFKQVEPEWRKNVNNKLSFYINKNIPDNITNQFVERVKFDNGIPVVDLNISKKSVAIESCKSTKLASQLKHVYKMRLKNHPYFVFEAKSIDKSQLDYNLFAKTITNSISCALDSKELKTKVNTLLATDIKNKDSWI